MNIDYRVQRSPFSGVITSECVFENFMDLILVDVGGDGFRLGDAIGMVINCPTGVPIRISGPMLRVSQYIKVLAPLSGSLNVSYICDKNVGSSASTELKLVFGALYNWPAASQSRVSSTYGYLFNWYAANKLSFTDLIIASTSNGNIDTIDGSGVQQLVAQSFITSQAKILHSITLSQAAFNGSPDFNIRLSLYNSSAGVPTTKILDSTNVISAHDFHQGGAINEFLFGDYSLAAGNYCFVLSYENIVTNNTSNSLSFPFTNTNLYTDGVFSYKIGAGAWIADVSGGDLYSKITFATRLFVPAGWHMPTSTELHTLMINLDAAGTQMSNTAGGKMKEIGTTHWTTPNTSADNTSGFTALPSGTRGAGGIYGGLGTVTWFMASDAINSTTYYCGGILSYDNAIFESIASIADKLRGVSVRLIKDDSTDPGSMTGNDGKIYKTVKIGSQVWMAQNSMETKYNDGTLIPVITDNTLWAADVTGARCVYNNDDSTVSVNVSLAPVGYHIPTMAEFFTLINHLAPGEGGKLKEVNPAYWEQNIGTEGTNETGFNGRGSGQINALGQFIELKRQLYLWSSSDSGSVGLGYNICQYSTIMSAGIAFAKTCGLAIRCVKDDSNNTGSMVDVDGNVYPTVKIGSQVWQAENLRVTKFNDGTPITNVTDPSTWAALSAAGMCYYNNNIGIAP
jgi:uncharacterized protein (TIGR02145 family)